jgi:hypothetical protein
MFTKPIPLMSIIHKPESLSETLEYGGSHSLLFFLEPPPIHLNIAIEPY